MTYSAWAVAPKSSLIFTQAIMLLFLGCNQNEYTKLSEDQLIKRITDNTIPDAHELQILNTLGDEIAADSLTSLTRSGKYFVDFYVDKNEEIVRIIVREKTKKDDELITKIEQKIVQIEEAMVLKPVEINCSDKVKILQNVFDRDQAMRTGSGSIDPEIDHENLEIVVSFLEKCGMPTLQEVDELQMAGIWAVLQHGPAKYQKKYIPLLEESAERGDINWGVIALMKDRALMYEGKPQIYGSQVKHGELYTLHEPEFVNQRRSEMGMEPLEDYLQRFDIDFNVEQKQKDSLYIEEKMSGN